MMVWGVDAGAWVWMFVWVVALVVMVWLIVRPDHREPSDDPEAILRTRFARGEINAEELERAELILSHETRSTR